MKQVVLSEGKWDVKLVSYYYEQFHSDLLVDTFIGEEIPYSDLKNQESNAIENFLEPRNPYDVLVKSENGKSDLKLIFVKLVRYLLGQDVQVCLLIDLDGGDHDRLLRELDEQVRSNYDGRECEIVSQEPLAKSPVQVCSRNRLLEDGSVRGEFDVVAFRHTLDTAADIDKETDSDEVKERKLREFVTDDHHASPLHTVL